tara:strand:- start:1204 stop:1635 length:432 start_codon:yes stop_codon:yes gene_type:complete
MIVSGTAKWASVFKPNDMSNKYQVDICQLDKETVKELEGVGITVKIGEGKKEDQESYITAKTVRPPRVMDSKKNPWPTDKLVGNGSKVKVSVNPYEWNFQGKSGISASLNSMMVVKLVEYVGSSDELDEEDGFVLDDADMNEL